MLITVLVKGKTLLKNAKEYLGVCQAFMIEVFWVRGYN